MTEDTKRQLEEFVAAVWPDMAEDPNVRWAMVHALSMPGNQAFLAGVNIGARLMARRMANHFKPGSMP